MELIDVAEETCGKKVINRKLKRIRQWNNQVKEKKNAWRNLLIQEERRIEIVIHW